MSLITQTRPSVAPRGSGSVITPLEIALSKFAGALTDNERKDFQRNQGVPDASAVLTFTAKLDQSNPARRGKSIGSRVYFLLLSVQKFSNVIGTFVSSNPAIAALVWGSIQLTILVALNIASYFETLTELFMDLNKLCPRFNDYELLYPNSPELQRSICEFHASIVEFCQEFIMLTRQPWVRKMTTSLRDKLQSHMNNIKRNSLDVKEAIALAKAIYDRRAQDFQRKLSKVEAKKSNRLLVLTSQTQQELEAAREWQVQRQQDISREKKRRLLDSLSTYEYRLNFHQTRTKRHVNTAIWLLSTPQFVEWRDADTPSVFFLTGKLGSGKTVLTTSVIDHLHCKRKPDEHIAFLFPRFDDSASLRAETVLRSIIRQTFEIDTILSEEAERLLSKLEAPFAGIGIVEELLNHCINQFSTCYIIIDSLDELASSELDILLGILSRTIANNSKAKLFFVGRDSVLKDIQNVGLNFHQVSVKTAKVQSDIEVYTRETIAAKWGEERILQSPTLVDEIIKTLTNKADGMFLWVDYQIIEICKQTCDADIRLVLGNLPKDLGETFDRAMKRILRYGPVKTATNVFRWAATAKRPLTVTELEEALSYEPGQAYTIPEKKPKNLVGSVTTWCENLIELDDELSIVRYPHSSVWEHFLKQPSDSSLEIFHIRSDDADHFVGEICVTYLNLNDFKTALAGRHAGISTKLPSHVMKEISKRRPLSSRLMIMAQKHKIEDDHASAKTTKQRDILIRNSDESWNAKLNSGHPFLNYALEYWLIHTRNFNEQKSRTWDTWKLMLSDSHDLASTPWSQEQYNSKPSIAYDWVIKHDHFPAFQQMIGLFTLDSKKADDILFRYAELGHVKFIGAAINFDVSSKGLSVGLIHAAKYGHLGAVQLLLNTRVGHSSGRIALQAAAGGGHLDVIQLLLDAKVDVNASANYNGLTALQAAAGGGYLEVVQLLLTANADVNAPANYNGHTALQAAAGNGHLDIVQLLLDAKADINAAGAFGYNGRTALQAAAGGGHLEVVQLLLDVKVDVNAPADYSGLTALQAAARGGHLEVVQLLLDAKADVSATGAFSYDGRTALQAAAGGGHLDVVQLLLDTKADVNAPADYGRLTALQAAASGGHLEVVQLLLDANADVNAPANYSGLTALQAAAGGGHLEVVQLLLDVKADVNAPSNYSGLTALQAAARCGHLEVVQLLLNAKADVNAPADYSGLTALQAAAGGGYLEIVQLLLDAKADVNAAGSLSYNGRTALQVAAGAGHLDVVQLLLAKKADVNAPADDIGITALQAAARGGHLEVAQLLINSKADVNAYAGSGGITALQAAIGGGHQDMVQLLLDSNADTAGVNFDRTTVL